MGVEFGFILNNLSVSGHMAAEGYIMYDVPMFTLKFRFHDMKMHIAKNVGFQHPLKVHFHAGKIAILNPVWWFPAWQFSKSLLFHVKVHIKQ